MRSSHVDLRFQSFRLWEWEQTSIGLLLHSALGMSLRPSECQQPTKNNMVFDQRNPRHSPFVVQNIVWCRGSSDLENRVWHLLFLASWKMGGTYVGKPKAATGGFGT